MPLPGRDKHLPPRPHGINEAVSARTPCCDRHQSGAVGAGVCPRASDAFLQLAMAGKADTLVTGDQDLLSLAGAFACPIVTAEQFIKTLNR